MRSRLGAEVGRSGIASAVWLQARSRLEAEGGRSSAPLDVACGVVKMTGAAERRPLNRERRCCVCHELFAADMARAVPDPRSSER